MEHLTWGYPVIFYLFLAGLGAGSLTVSASILLRGKGGEFGGEHFKVARYGALLAPFPVMLGAFLLVFELGSFQAGRWLKWLNLYKTINLSPMSVGTWLLTALIAVSLVYAYTFLPSRGKKHDPHTAFRKNLAWLAVPLGIGVAVYTGVLLGSMAARPFWNSPVIALIFLLSALSTGVAATILIRTLFGNRRFTSENEEKGFHQSGYLLTSTDLIFIGLELVSIFLYLMYAYLSVEDVRHAVSVVLFGGKLAFSFWVFVVFIGLLLPAILELIYVVPRLLYQREYRPPRWLEVAVPLAILLGGFMLRYIIIVAGQITGPIGI